MSPCRNVQPQLQEVLLDLIENNGVDLFYVGNHGQFDSLVRRTLRNLSRKYPIRYYIVQAYVPTKKDEYDDDPNTIYPDGLETTPPKYAIVKRNEWMLNHADFVVTCIDDPFGNAAKMQEKAQRKEKAIIRLGRY